MTIKEVWKYVGDWFAKLLAVICILAIIGGAIKTCSDGHEKTSTPVEKERIDSITKENDKLILEVETLDSIKDVKTIEVKSLSNDSTLRLFYKLIGK